MSFSTVFQSYQDTERVNMKGSALCNEALLKFGKNLTFSWIQIPHELDLNTL